MRSNIKKRSKIKMRSAIKKRSKIKRVKVEWLLLQKRDCMKLAAHGQRVRHCSLVIGLVFDLVFEGKSLQFSRISFLLSLSNYDDEKG